ncbi:hypothetical protein QAD02_009827 [Eretmocerus hayati]|uniref:Uncharacterized protein n=1 Tax=Eretmocerus hayati TaxID=131215 RepID=A0ACC2NCU7_9HYME|nr:hypothetical protein QAD02_009827 [Eretmocerus hayati]
MLTRTKSSRAGASSDEPTYTWNVTAESLQEYWKEVSSDDDDPDSIKDSLIGQSPCFYVSGHKWSMRVDQVTLMGKNYQQLQVSLEIRDPPAKSDLRLLVQYSFIENSPTHNAAPKLIKSPLLKLHFRKGNHQSEDEYCAVWPLSLNAEFDQIYCCMQRIDTSNVELDHRVSPVMRSSTPKNLKRTPVSTPTRKRRSIRSKSRSKRPRKVKSFQRSNSFPNLLASDCVDSRRRSTKSSLFESQDSAIESSRASSSTSFIMEQSPLQHQIQLNMIKDFGSSLEDKDYSDVTFISSTECKFNAHKIIIKVRAPALHDWYKLQPSVNQTVNFDDVPDSVFEQVLAYIYRGDFKNVDSQTTLELFSAATKFKLSDLAEQCIRAILEGITINNAADILIMASMHAETKLKNHAVNFIKTNIDEFMNTEGFVKLDSHPSLHREIIRCLASKSK